MTKALALSLACLAACATDDVLDEEIDGDSEEVLDDPDADSKEDAALVWFTPITKEYFLPSVKVRAETRMLFKSEAEWVAHFGQPSPGIDFTTKWAIFYTPGTDNLAVGDRAKLARVSRSSTGKTLYITTRLESNGDCAWRSARPFVTATIPKQTAATYKRFYKSNTNVCP